MFEFGVIVCFTLFFCPSFEEISAWPSVDDAKRSLTDLQSASMDFSKQWMFLHQYYVIPLYQLKTFLLYNFVQVLTHLVQQL